jgi:tRNA(fMet)-specific endonuclease VapC
MICLDTNAVIGALKTESSPVLERVARGLREGWPLAVSTLVLFELHFGAAKSAHPGRNARRIAEFTTSGIRVLGFETDDAAEAGDIRNHLRKSGTPIGPYDLLIAAQARRRDAVLVTANMREFARVPGLKLEDWTGSNP